VTSNDHVFLYMITRYILCCKFVPSLLPDLVVHAMAARD